MASLEPKETGGELVPLRPGDGGHGPVHPRAEMVQVLAERGFGRNEISRRTGIPEVSVSRIAESLGITFDRSQTEQALKARLADLKESQMGLAMGAIEDMIKARYRIATAATDRDFAFATKAFNDLSQVYQRLVPQWTPEDVNEEATSFLDNLMRGIKRQDELFNVYDEMYDRGELEEIPASYVEYRKKREENERADREGFH
ncbi:hypothetical protein ACIGW0_00515 [Streptomyces bikiniensis]|uniref:Uncharacterized protein n=1 Tax=Streptomyces bikiniensis TaxID=1896 RepID=A0ABW8CK14_STRBI